MLKLTIKNEQETRFTCGSFSFIRSTCHQEKGFRRNMVQVRCISMDQKVMLQVNRQILILLKVILNEWRAY